MLKITFKKKKEEDKKIQNKENKIKQFLKTLILKIDKVELALVVLIKKKQEKMVVVKEIMELLEMNSRVEKISITLVKNHNNNKMKMNKKLKHYKNFMVKRVEI